MRRKEGGVSTVLGSHAEAVRSEDREAGPCTQSWAEGGRGQGK